MNYTVHLILSWFFTQPLTSLVTLFWMTAYNFMWWIKHSIGYHNFPQLSILFQTTFSMPWIMIASLYNWLQEIEAEEALSNSFNETSVTLISKPNEGTKRKENFRSKCLRIGMLKSSKIVANWTQQCLEIIIHHDQVGYISDLQDWYIWNKLLKKKNHIILSIES